MQNESYALDLLARKVVSGMIKQALADALNPTNPLTLRKEARGFLNGNDSVRNMCCAKLGIDPRSIQISE